MTLKAKYPGTCHKCGRHIAAGELIVWQKDRKTGKSMVECYSTPECEARVYAASVQEQRRYSQRPTGVQGLPTAARPITRCKGCRGPIKDAPQHRAMGGYCGACAFDEFDM